MVDIEIISRGEYDQMKKEKGFSIQFGFHESPFGKCLVGLFGDRICHLSFVGDDDSVNLNTLKSQWPDSVLIKSDKLTADVAKKIFESETEEFKVILKGTRFEGEVWRAVARIPKGETASYEAVAADAGRGRAVRAAANAVAKNFVAYLIPCHRVIKKDGSIHKYGWGTHIKKKILEFENVI